MLKRKVVYFLALVFSLTFFNSVFFYYYYLKIDLNFSWLTILFIFLFSLNFSILFHLIKNVYLRLVSLLFYLVFIFYFLINFSYYDVFQIFWKIDIRQLGQLNSAQADLLLSYYNLIPVSLYFSAFALFAITIAGVELYAWKKRAVRRRLEKLFASVNFIEHKKNKISTPAYFIVAALIIGQVISLLMLLNYKEGLKKTSAQKEKYYGDLGPYGYLLDQAYGRIKEDIKPSPAGFTAGSQEKNIDLLKESLDNLRLLQNTKSEPPIKLKSKLEKPHIIIYQMESVGAWALKQEPSPMPFLSKLISENISVGEFYSNSCTTINAEFAANCSFYPESTGPISDLFAGNNYYCLPTILKNQYGYRTNLYHANNASFWNRDTLGPKWGFNNLYFSPRYKVRTSDAVVLDDVINNIKKANQPTYNYVIGFSTHGPHDQNFIEFNHYENNLEISPYFSKLSSSSLTVKTDEETIRNYFGFLTAADESLKKLFERLAAESLLDKTIVIIYGDHRYYNFSSDNAVNDFNNYNELPFAMYVPGGYKGKIKEIASQVDIAPTILNLIEGSGYKLPEYFIGRSLFSDSQDNGAVSKCLGEGLYINQDVIIRTEKLLDAFAPLVFKHKYAKFKYEEYISSFSAVLKSSDAALNKDEIVEAAASSSEKIIKKEVYFNQETDSDKDGLSDLREKTIGTDRFNPDTDGDGYLDGIEIINSYNPKGAGKINY